jgi:hypothetical protein
VDRSQGLGAAGIALVVLGTFARLAAITPGDFALRQWRLPVR